MPVLNLGISETFKKNLEKYCEKTGLKKSEVTRTAITKYLGDLKN